MSATNTAPLRFARSRARLPYTLVGATSPTDTLSHTGTLGSASFNANFTTRLIYLGLALNINGVDWYARGNATYDIGDNKFEGTYDDVRAQNLVRGQGTLYGFFTQPRIGTATSAGAGMSYNITDNSRQLGVISGVLAFVEGGADATVTPPAIQSRDLAFIAPEAAAVGPQAVRSAPTDYALDSNFRLTSLTGTTNSGTIDGARYDIGSARVMSSGVSPLVMLRWGAGPTVWRTSPISSTARRTRSICRCGACTGSKAPMALRR